jgi:ABC-type phosphate/phosphonate transport system substrate-binding protein
MFSLIGAVFKYSFLVLVVLVLSHIVEVQGVTISQHVLNGMHAISGYTPKAQAEKITSSFTKTMQERMKDLNKLDNEVSPEDQKALNRVIESSAHQKR